MNTAAKVAQNKEKHPEHYCPTHRCLWRTGGGHCPRHTQNGPKPKTTVTDWILNGFQFPGKVRP
jgi:hypothetical protein